MSGISRRSILGYTSTAAAGTILTTAGTAHATGADARQADASSVEFPSDTEFKGSAFTTFPDGDDDSELVISFSVQHANTPSTHELTPEDVADALSAYAQTKGWPSITFYGAPAPVAVN